MKNRYATRLLAVSSALAALLGGAVVTAPAAAAAGCSDDTTAPRITGITPATVVVGTTPKVVRFSTQATDACGIEAWSIDDSDALIFVYDGAPSWAFDMYSNDQAGTTHAVVTAYDRSYNEAIKVLKLTVLRNATFRSGSFNASPEPVKKSGSLTVKGTLARADWESGSYRNYANQTVKIQFKAKGTSSYATVSSVKTDSAGAFSKKLSASRGDGTWRATYAGNSVTGTATSATDYVDVR